MDDLDASHEALPEGRATLKTHATLGLGTLGALVVTVDTSMTPRRPFPSPSSLSCRGTDRADNASWTATPEQNEVGPASSAIEGHRWHCVGLNWGTHLLDVVHMQGTG
jgi:hypothetical protein